MRLLIKIGLLSCMCLLLLVGSCEVISFVDSGPPIHAELTGSWEWVRTESPSGTITPETEGYEEDISFGNNGEYDYMVIYRNDTLWLPLFESRRKYVEADNKANTILIHYRHEGSIKYFLRFNQYKTLQEFERSELMEEYTESADTIRHIYVWKSSIPRNYDD